MVWGTDHRVGIVTAGTGAVQWTDAAPNELPTRAGFVGDMLVVTTPDETIGIDSAGKAVWKVAAATLPPVELTIDTNTRREAGEGGVTINRGVINGRVLNGQFRGQLQIINGRVVPMPQVQQQAEPAEDAAANAERFSEVRLLSDRVVLATTTGRVLAVDLALSALAWQNRVSESGVSRLLSSDDFIAAGFIDPANGSEAYVFDAVTGQTVLHKSYDGNNNPQAGGLVNLALSPDGVLVTMQAGRLTAVDLYDIGSGDRKYDAANARGNGMMAMPFIQSMNEGQLVISGDKVLAVYAGMTGQQSVHAYDLRTMRAVSTTDPRTRRETEVGFGMRRLDPDGTPMRILASGNAFYVVGQRTVLAFDTSKPAIEPAWETLPGARDRKPMRDCVLSQDYLVQIAPTTPVNIDAERLPAARLSIYSRSKTEKGGESGLLEQVPVLQEPAGIMAENWQLTDGAFFFITGDNKLKVARVNK
ncbi:MAG: PQQ-binding-like beta-propeller repeat protein [Tepidisphaeraceae bacterium]